MNVLNEQQVAEAQIKLGLMALQLPEEHVDTYSGLVESLLDTIRAQRLALRLLTTKLLSYDINHMSTPYFREMVEKETEGILNTVVAHMEYAERRRDD